MDIISLSSRLPQMVLGSKSDDDFSDRLNYKYTVGLLILFSVIIQARLFGSEVSNNNKIIGNLDLFLLENNKGYAI